MNPATIASIQVNALLTVLAELGVDSDRVCARAGLARARLAEPLSRIPASYDRALWDAAIEQHGDPALGLLVAERFAHGMFGSFEYLLHNCSTLAELVERANEFMRLIDDLARVEVCAEGELVSLQLYRLGGYPIPPQGVECVFALLRAKASSLGGADLLREVRFAHPAAAPIARYEAAFGCPVRFAAESNALVGNAASLQLTLPGDPRLRAVLEEHARSQLAQVPDVDPFLYETRQRLVAQLREGVPDVTKLARAMRMSERSLRRRLQAAGTGYQELLDGLRAQRARELMLRPSADATRVAEQLGFADPSTFYRAFKRWTGQTPAQYRSKRPTAET